MQAIEDTSEVEQTWQGISSFPHSSSIKVSKEDLDQAFLELGCEPERRIYMSILLDEISSESRR